MSGIISYGTYIPKNRIRLSEISNTWNKEGVDIEKSLGLTEKSVAGIDEDAATLAAEAAYQALTVGQINPTDIEAITIGSESHPYAVKPTSTIVGEILGCGNNYLAADLEFACKAGTAGIQLVSGLIDSKRIKYGLVIGSDVAQARPADVLEYTAASAAGAIVLGNKNVIAEIVDFTSYSSNTPDFWRRDGQKYPSHGGRFTGGPAYFAHVMGASKKLLAKTKMKPSDFDYVVFHMPNSKFPRDAAKKLGFTPAQLAPGFTVEKIGNPYSAATFVGLAAVLDVAKPNQKIFVCSYGSGAGSDSFIYKTTPALTAFQKRNKNTVDTQVKNKRYIVYSEIAKSVIARHL